MLTDLLINNLTMHYFFTLFLYSLLSEPQLTGLLMFEVLFRDCYSYKDYIL